VSYLSSILTLVFTISSYFFIYSFYSKFFKKRGILFWKRIKLNKKHPLLNLIFGIGLILSLASSLAILSFNISHRIAYLKLNISGTSKWINTNGQKYLQINVENNYDLGYHTGFQLSAEIFKMKFLLSLSEAAFGVSYAQMASLSENYLPYIPQKYIEEIQGISDGATAGGGFPISFTDILIQNVLFEILYGQINPLSASLKTSLGCTSFGSKNDDSTIIIGQNMDLVKPFSMVQAFVLHKIKNEPYVFTYRLGGCLALPMGKNEYGVTLITNLVQTKIIAPITTPTCVVVREGLETKQNIDKLYELLFPDNESAYSRNFIIANRTSVLSVQSLPNNQTTLYSNSIMVHSNTYINRFWQNYLIDTEYSKERQLYAEKLLNIAYSDKQINDLELLTILKDTPIICREEQGIVGMRTVAFMTSYSFGLGNPNDCIGVIPI
jgi:hypothetical protein